MLGKLDPANFAGGSITLHQDRAAAALEKVIGASLDVDVTEAAWGLAEVVDENMANAARVHAVENGEDLSQYTMIAFGGAAPLHAARLCEKLGISRCLVPEGAGVGSAIGFLRAPFSFEASRSRFMRLNAFDADSIRALYAEMEAEARSFVRSCDSSAEINAEYKAYMRYAGQGWEIPIDLTAEDIADPQQQHFERRFEDAYSTLFGRTVEGMVVEITVWSVNAFTPPEDPQPLGDLPGKDARDIGHTPAVDPSGEVLTAAEIERLAMTPGMQASGPAVITEAETTVVVPDSSISSRKPMAVLISIAGMKPAPARRRKWLNRVALPIRSCGTA